MLQPIVGRALLTALWVCSYLLLSTAVGATQPLEQSAPHLPAPQFGGGFRRVLGNNPATLDPALLTDIYGRAVVSQVFDGWSSLMPTSRPSPLWLSFGRLLGMDEPGRSPCAEG